MVADALQRLRTLTSDLQVTDSVKVNLRASLQQILEEIEREHSIAFSLRDHVGNKARSFLAVGLSRIAREALTNVTKHARASHVDVSIAEINGGVQITIADDGVGFQEDETRNPEHMGLASMRSRAHALGGALRIYPRDGGGTCLEIWAPEPQQRRSSDRAG